MDVEKTIQNLGPIQVVAVAFGPGTKFEGKILEEFERLEKKGIIRVIDLLFVQKEENSDLVALNFQGEELGGIVGALLGFEFEGDIKENIIEEYGNGIKGLNLIDIQKLGETLTPGMAAGIVLIEHLWAKDLKRTIRSNGGIPVAEGFLTKEAIGHVSLEISELTNFMDEMDKAGDMQQAYA